MPEQLSPGDARKLALQSQKVLTKAAFGRGANATLNAIRHLGYVQIDTISVVARAHHHTLWNRNPSYREQHLIALQREGKIFEYWAHAAAFLPIEDYRFCLPRMHSIANGDRPWFKLDQKVVREVLARIRSEGPLQAKDFAHPRKQAATWWDWKPAKKALEQLFMSGELMAVRGQNFQKTYDLRDRLLPPDVDTTPPTPTEFARHLIITHLRAHGIGQASEMAYQRKGVLPQIRRLLSEMTEDGEIITVQAAGEIHYCLPEALALLRKPLARKTVKILSPFDNLIIQRKRVKKLFDFDYQIECYLPAHKRKHGYFSLPLLWDRQLVGQMDAKAIRPEKRLLVRNLTLEPELDISDDFIEALVNELGHFMAFNGCDTLTVDRVPKRAIKAALSNAWA